MHSVYDMQKSVLEINQTEVNLFKFWRAPQGGHLRFFDMWTLVLEGDKKPKNMKQIISDPNISVNF